MPYTIVDLLDKFINIEQNGYEMFLKIAGLDNMPANIKTIAKVFAKEELRHIELYKNLKDEKSGRTDMELGFDIYDKASKLISEFSKVFQQSKTENIKEILEFSLDFEKENLALLLSIQGLLVSSDNSQSKSYKVFSEIINEELIHVENVNYFIK